MEHRLPFDINEIKKFIPHRYPFLLLDRVVELTAFKSIKALKNISMCDPVFQGHFPKEPVFPGVLLIEGLAQASGILGNFSCNRSSQDLLLTEIISARFRKKVIPGDTVYFIVNLDKQRGSFYWFSGQAKVSNDVVVSVKFSAYMK